MSQFETKSKFEFAGLIGALVASVGILLPNASYAIDDLDVFKPIEGLPEVEVGANKASQAPAVARPRTAQVPQPARRPARPVVNNVQSVPASAEARTASASASAEEQPIVLPEIVVTAPKTNDIVISEVDGPVDLSPILKNRPKREKIAAPRDPEYDDIVPTTGVKQGKKNSKLAPVLDEEYSGGDEPDYVPAKQVKSRETAPSAEEIDKGFDEIVPKAGSKEMVSSATPANNTTKLASTSTPLVQVKPAEPKKEVAKKEEVKKTEPKSESGIGKTLAELVDGKKAAQKANPSETSVTASMAEKANEQPTQGSSCANNEMANALTSQAEEIIRALEQASCHGCAKLTMLKEKLLRLKVSDSLVSRMETEALLKAAAEALREMQREAEGKLSRAQAREVVAFLRVAERKDLHRKFIGMAEETLVANKDIVLEEIRRQPNAGAHEASKLTRQTRPHPKQPQPRLIEI